MRVALIDNYDSFTYNLVHYIEQIVSEEVMVFRNDIDAVEILDTFDCIVFSPGPGLPKHAGKMMHIISLYYQTKPLLGICLGHQALAEFFGANLINLNNVCHGESMPLFHNNDAYIYTEIANPSFVGRYHSWVVSQQNLPSCLKVTAYDASNLIMSIEHKFLPIVGLQYHPESILSNSGLAILENYFNYVANKI